MARPKASSPLPEYVDAFGEVRRLGTLLPPKGYVPPFRASVPTYLPESEWVEFDMRDEGLPLIIKDQDGYGACFPVGTRIRMEDGSERAIEDVRLRDRVLTAEGNIRRVVRTMVRDADDGLVRLSLWGHNHLRATAEHPILTERGYVPAGQLRAGDWVAMPCYLPASRKFILTADHVSRRRVPSMSAPGGAGYREWHEDNYFASLPDAIEMTPAVGRIFGLFLAEGHTTKRGKDSTHPDRLIWTFSKDERDTLAAELIGLLESEWGLKPVIVERPQHAIDIRINSGAWARLFASLCSCGARGKRLHPDLTSGPEGFLSAILDGWLAGDGHARRNEIQGVTVSRDLALGMFDIAQGLGRCPAIRRYHSPTYGTVKVRQPRWEVNIRDNVGDSFRSRTDGRHVWRKVRGIEREPFSGPVFNLEVEGDNSYVAEGIGVHNCNGHAAATSLEAARWIAGEEYVPLSAWYVYSILCNGIDRGSMIADALELLVAQGTCPESDVPYGTINPRKLSAQAKQQAGRFKIEIGARLATFEEMMVSTQLRRPFNFSICVGSGFDQLDSDGCPRISPGPGNHAVAGGFGAKRCPNGEWAFLWPNSWSERWGLQGWAWMKKNGIYRQSYFEAYNVVAVEADPDRPEKPPVAPG